MLKQEQQERAYLKAHPEENRNLYPTLNDALFNVKIAEKKEFNDTQYDGTVYDVKKQADILANAEFELQPHQLFVRNFMSFNTPYNSLLLYHGLGSGKTCSAIGVCEEMRDYLKQTGLDKKIIIVASPNVQDNFRLQLFDERKLKKVGNTWTMGGCIGDKLLKEIQPSGMKPIEREKIQSQIKSLINNYYEFVGYTEFSNYLEKKSKVIKSEFSNRLIVIDEVHNIIDEGQNVSKTAGQTIKKIANQMIKLVKGSDNVRLLLLSATPMYNSYKEILWLINLMNINDKRASISVSDIFDKDGEFKEPSGKELFMQKITGYVSYVRGENPYTFPYKVYPHLFSPANTYAQIRRPTIQMNTKEIAPEDAMQNLNLFLTKIGPYQQKGYDYIIDSYSRKQFDESAIAFEDMQSFGYTILRLPLEALNMVYPMDIDFAGGAGSSSSTSLDRGDEGEEEGEEGEEGEEDESEESVKDGASIRVSELTGIHGLERLMNFENSKSRGTKGGFSYKESTLSKYGRIFSHKEIGKYSCKIKNICDNLAGGCQGIVMIYSEYLDAGLIPAVLAIEELGFVRYQGGGGKTLLTEKAMEKEIRGNYAFISGDKRLSPDNNKEIKALTSDNNKNGEKIKIVFISRAGAEGLDLKFIRQVHILEPWYNLNRIEQIIGRAVRNFSHKELPFEKRNVQVFLYGTVLRDETVEAADVYVYRFAESKSIKIGKITRLMKETSVDCILNHNQTNFTISNMGQKVEQVLSNKMVLSKFKVGDEPFSSACDYMGECEYTCNPDKEIESEEIREENYNEKYIATNTDRIIYKIKKLFYDKYLYKKAILIGMVNTPKPYPTAQIYYAITQMIENRDVLVDKYNRHGYLINNGEYYLFQPVEIKNKNISLFEREFPVEFKPEKILVKGIVEKKEEQDYEKPAPIMDLTIDKMTTDYELAVESYSEISSNPSYKVQRGDDNWFKHCGVTIYKLEKKGYNKKELFKMLVEHIVDIMSFKTKLHVLQYVFSEKVDGIFREMREYFEENFVIYKSLVCIILYDDQTPVIMKLTSGKTWSIATEMEQRDILKQMEKEERNLANIVGFMQYDNTTDSFMFKIKNNMLAKNLGASCEQMNKIKKIEMLNLILGEKEYTSENTRGMVQSELCSLIEFILRDKTKKTESVWFYDNEIKLKKN